MSDITLRRNDLADLKDLGAMLVESRLFKDTTQIAQAVVKVQAGRELGLGPIEAMRAFHIIEGKVEASADLLATLVKRHPSYDFRVLSMDNEEVSIEFRQDGEVIGISTFSMNDARTAGLAGRGPWKNYPRNMLWARAMSNGVAWFCPDVTSGRIYSEGEIDLENEEAPETTVIDLDPADLISEEEITDAEIVEDEPVSDPTEGAEQPDGMVVGESPAPVSIPPRETPSGRAPVVETEPMVTTAQLKKMAVIANGFGWGDEARHLESGVGSWNELTKRQASALIELWATPSFITLQASLGAGSASTGPEGTSVSTAVEGAVEAAGDPAEAAPSGKKPASAGSPADDLVTESGPPSDVLVQRAQAKWGTKNRVLVEVRKLYPDVNSWSEITHDALADTLTKALEA